MMGHELIFIMQGWNMRGTFNIWRLEKNGKKMVQFFSNPKFGVGTNVWS